MLQAVTEEAKRVDQLVFFALRGVLEGLGVQGNELLENGVACLLAKGAQTHTCDLHRV